MWMVVICLGCDGRHRVQLVIKEAAAEAALLSSIPPNSGRRRPNRDGGGGEIALGLATLKTSKSALHTLIHSVILRHHPEGMPLTRSEAWTR